MRALARKALELLVLRPAVWLFRKALDLDELEREEMELYADAEDRLVEEPDGPLVSDEARAMIAEPEPDDERPAFREPPLDGSVEWRLRKKGLRW